MDIQEIKAQLSIIQVLSHYGIEVNRNGHIKCPFHDDQTASMKIYVKDGTAYCFAGGCKTAGHSIDVIDFIMYMENCTKHEAILKAKAMIGFVEPVQKQAEPKTAPVSSLVTRKVASTLTLDEVFKSMQNGFSRTRSAQEYAAKRGLDFLNLEIGYSSGQMHYKKDAQYLSDLEALHIIKPLEQGGYLTFAKNGIIFPLKDSTGRTCSLYGRKIDGKGHYYLTGRCGLYPGYPPGETKKVLLVESVIDAATLLQIKELSDYFILALYGTNGLTSEHKTALQALPNLEEVVLMLDGDEAGRKAAIQYKSELQGLFSSIEPTKELPLVEIKKVDLPQDADVNELWVNHNEPQLFLDLLQNAESPINITSQALKASPVVQVTPLKKVLNTSETANLKYFCEAAKYYVKGFASSIGKGLDSLRVTLTMENERGRTYRSKVELYEHRDLLKYCQAAAKELDLDEAAILLEISELADELEKYRNELLAAKGTVKKPKAPIPPELAAECRNFGKLPDLYGRLNEKLGATGIVGEEQTRFLVFAVAVSYMQKQPLHVLIQGSSASGKTLLLRKIMELLPEEKSKVYTRITEKSLYHTGNELRHTTMAIEDWDGLPIEVQYVVREFQTGEGLSSLSTVKDAAGDSKSSEIRAYGPIASIMCTTHGSIYEDNMSRCFLVAVDESEEQTRRILEYQNARRRGDIDKKAEEEAKNFIHNFIEILKPCEVVNPFAGKVNLPDKAHKIRRLNDLYLIFVEQIAWLHQFQRQKDGQGRIIATKEDLKLACSLLFETIVLKVDELDGALRMFFENLKEYVLAKGGQNEPFTQREVRQALNFTKVRLHNYLQELIELEYIQLAGGYANKGYQYRIIYWDDNQRLRREIKDFLDDQLDKL